MAKGIGPTAGSNAVKKAIKYCKGNPCDCLAEAINRLVDGHEVSGQKPNKGIGERIDRMLATDADPPGTMFNGKDTWQTHTDELRQRQQALDNLLQEYDAQGCGGGGGGVAVNVEAAKEAAKRPIPTPDDYWDLYPDRRPSTRSAGTSSSPGFWKRAAYGLGGTALLVGAGALVFVSFDGPAGEYAAGAAGLGLWGAALGN